jgi:transcriptional regulator with XRE-family HTH domain
MTIIWKLPTRTAELLRKRMGESKVSIGDLAQNVGATYEHVRMIVRGRTTPSKVMVRALADALKLNRDELERIATADRIRLKFGKIPLELSGKNPELEPLERIWKDLSEEHKLDLIAQAQAWAKRDGESGKKR